MRREARLGPAIGVALVHVAIGYALIVGLGRFSPGARRDDAPRLIVVEPDRIPPPPAPKPPVPKAREPAGGVRSTLPDPPPKAPPAPVVALPAPVPIVPLPLPTTTGGGAPTGSGAGGAGSGGGSGIGTGSGAGSDPGFVPAEQIKGRFRNSDFPKSLKQVGALKVGVRYAVQPDGRVGGCEIIEASGFAEADAMTCRVITERYRFRPARNGRGETVTEVVEEDYRWNMDD